MAASPPAVDPAVGLLELGSIAAGVVTGDAMVKASPVGSIYAGTVHPGRYLVLVSGDTASVEIALEVGGATGGADVLDSVFLADVHPDVTAALVSTDEAAVIDADAIGIVETATVAAVIEAADAGVKAAQVTLATVRLADGLGGKGYLVLAGDLAEVEAAMERAVDVIEQRSQLVRQVVVPQLADEMRANLAADLRFKPRVVSRPADRTT